MKWCHAHARKSSSHPPMRRDSGARSIKRDQRCHTWIPHVGFGWHKGIKMGMVNSRLLEERAVRTELHGLLQTAKSHTTAAPMASVSVIVAITRRAAMSPISFSARTRRITATRKTRAVRPRGKNMAHVFILRAGREATLILLGCILSE